MQDPSGGYAAATKQPHFPEQEQLKCPRCDSPNTKFCYYNNYNLLQPRHFCKNCRRYWTKGGALRNIPVGGGSRKNTKKSSSSSKRSSSSSATSAASSNNNSNNNSVPQNLGPKPEPGPPVMWVDQVARGGNGMMDMNVNGSFSSLLASNGQFGNLFEGMNAANGNGPGIRALEFGEFGDNLNLNSGSDAGRNTGLEMQNGNGSDGYLGMQNGDSNCWNGSGNGWPDLAIYTPGSTYQ